jgi:hypothetical protein
MAPKFDPQGAANFTFATTGSKVCTNGSHEVQQALLLDLGHGRTMAGDCAPGVLCVCRALV